MSRGNFLKINREGMEEQIKKFSDYPEVSYYQAEMMLHALGADHKAFRKGKNGKTFHAFRNRYVPGGKDIALWDDLTAKEMAEKRESVYVVSVTGIRALEFLTQCRIWDDYHCATDCRSAVLHYVMERDVYCGYGCWLPVSISDISLSLAMPRKLVTETIHVLWEEGYVKKGSYGGCTDEGFPYCYHGWYLTDKAREEYSEKYEALQKAEYKRIDDSMRNS